MNCKPPCMAIIVSSDFSEHIGLPVEVLAECEQIDGHFCWVVQAPRPIPAWHPIRGCTVTVTEFVVPDAHLRPITGLPITDDVTDEEKVPA